MRSCGWPGFTPQARQIGAAAIFALPLQIGAIRVGSLGLYRDKPGPLRTLELGDALTLADAATVVLPSKASTAPEEPRRRGAGPGGQRAIGQGQTPGTGRHVMRAGAPFDA